MKKVLKFYSETCGPCKVMSKNLKELQDIEVVDIDVYDENNEELIEKWDIRTVPTIIVVDDNEVLGTFKGITPIEEIQKIIYG